MKLKNNIPADVTMIPFSSLYSRLYVRYSKQGWSGFHNISVRINEFLIPSGIEINENFVRFVQADVGTGKKLEKQTVKTI